jgi:hypothetical protein
LIIMEFMEIIKQHELEEAFKLLKELAPEVIEDNFLKFIDHELIKNHKL